MDATQHAASRAALPCAVPACSEQRETEDCCYIHSQPGELDEVLNDGIIDWMAVEVAAERTRPVRLTWLEREIAAATILANGGSQDAAAEVMGVSRKTLSNHCAGRYAHLYAMAEALAGECDDN